VTHREVDHIVLERAKYAAIGRLSKEFANPAKVDVQAVDFMADDLCIRIIQHIAKQKLKEEFVVATWPADWWQALKARFAPKWFLRRWPVAMAEKKATFEVGAYYPLIAMPEQRSYIHIQKLSDIEWEES
jgi:hypothetical protein